MGFKTIIYITNSSTNDSNLVLCETIPVTSKPTYKVGDKYLRDDKEVIILSVQETKTPPTGPNVIWLNDEKTW